MTDKPDKFVFVDIEEPVETITTYSITGIRQKSIINYPAAYKINDGPWVVGKNRIGPGDTITIKTTSAYSVQQSATITPRLKHDR